MKFRFQKAQKLARPDQRGITLVESMVVVALMAILAALAAPSFTGTLERFRIDKTRDGLISSINFARVEAIRTGVPVIISRRIDCAVPLIGGQDWSCGWLMYSDLNGNNAQNANEPTIQNSEEPNRVNVMHIGGAQLTVNRFGQPGMRRFVISPAGVGVANPNTFTICMNIGGRIRSFKDEVQCP